MIIVATLETVVVLWAGVSAEMRRRRDYRARLDYYIQHHSESPLPWLTPMCEVSWMPALQPRRGHSHETPPRAVLVKSDDGRGGPVGYPGGGDRLHPAIVRGGAAGRMPEQPAPARVGLES